MFGTLLERLSGLFSRSFFPSLIFAFVNALLLYINSEWFHAHATTIGVSGDTPLKGMVIVVAFISVAVFAYLLSSINLFLREVLEGNHWPRWRWLREGPLKNQQEKLNELRSSLNLALREIIRFRESRPEWLNKLKIARKEGRTKGLTIGSVDEARGHTKYCLATSNLDEVERSIIMATTAALSQKIGNAVDAVAATLEASNADAVVEGGENPADVLHIRLVGVMDEADVHLRNAWMRLSSEIQLSFDQADVVPTTLGNIARTAQSYAADRYGINLTSIWTRLQKIMQADKQFYPTIEDAKTQLDFLINSWWLTTGTTLAWLIELTCTSYSAAMFIAVGVLGPVFSWLFYRLAIESYRIFADLLRCAVDLYRFQILTALHMPLPEGNWEEQDIWNQIGSLYDLGTEARIRYRHPSSGA